MSWIRRARPSRVIVGCALVLALTASSAAVAHALLTGPPPAVDWTAASAPPPGSSGSLGAQPAFAWSAAGDPVAAGDGIVAVLRDDVHVPRDAAPNAMTAGGLTEESAGGGSGVPGAYGSAAGSDGLPAAAPRPTWPGISVADQTTGRERWHLYRAGWAVHGVEVAGGTLVVVARVGSRTELSGYAATTGRRRWALRLPAGDDFAIGTPYSYADFGWAFRSTIPAPLEADTAEIADGALAHHLFGNRIVLTDVRRDRLVGVDPGSGRLAFTVHAATGCAFGAVAGDASTLYTELLCPAPRGWPGSGPIGIQPTSMVDAAYDSGGRLRWWTASRLATGLTFTGGSAAEVADGLVHFDLDDSTRATEAPADSGEPAGTYLSSVVDAGTGRVVSRAQERGHEALADGSLVSLVTHPVRVPPYLPDVRLVATDATTGAVRWNASFPVSSYPLNPITGSGAFLYVPVGVVTASGGVTGLGFDVVDAATGHVVGALPARPGVRACGADDFVCARASFSARVAGSALLVTGFAGRGGTRIEASNVGTGNLEPLTNDATGDVALVWAEKASGAS